MSTSKDKAPGNGGENGPQGIRQLKVGGVRVTPYKRRCAKDPDEYCDENYGWAWANTANVLGWLAEIRKDMLECCGGDIGPVTAAPPSDSCATWEGAWQELQTFGNDIFPFLQTAEAALQECSGAKIKKKLPKPKNGGLPGDNDGQLQRRACQRAKHYFRQLDKWANEFRDAFNEHCDDHESTHLSPPPDPPF